MDPEGGVHVPMSRPPYPPEFRAEMVRLVRSGRTPEELAKQFEPTAQAIRNWVKAADVEAASTRGEDLSADERQELQRLRKQVKQLQEEREILRKAAVSSLRRRTDPVEIQGDREAIGAPRRLRIVPGAGCAALRVLRLATRPLRARPT